MRVLNVGGSLTLGTGLIDVTEYEVRKEFYTRFRTVSERVVELITSIHNDMERDAQKQK